MKRIFSLVFFFTIYIVTQAQSPKPIPGATILQGLKKLKVLGSVLYLAAHPDDENTRLITYMANEKLYRTGYLSLTRGDGGQNLIGDEQGVDLGLIRTQELLSARRIDGGEQFFTRAFDFGFSKSPEEAFAIWNKQLVLSDVVWIIRNFQPDIIITRFPTTGEGGHGHHTASAILANEAFVAAADPSKFPEQLAYVKPWQVKRILWNTFNFGGTNTTDPSQFKIDDGGYNPLLGMSYGELAALSRSQHKSQGFGSAANLGQSWDFLKTTSGTPPAKELMDGVDITWNRIGKAGAKIEAAVNTIISSFIIDQPEKSVPSLVALYNVINNFPDSHWKKKKLDEVQSLIQQCSGLFLKAASATPFAIQTDSVQIAFSANNRLGVDATLQQISIEGKDIIVNEKLSANKNFTASVRLFVPISKTPTQPYWLQHNMEKGHYVVSDQLKIGQPDADPAYTAGITVKILTTNFTFQLPVVYNYTDPVRGELYEPLVIVPPVSINLLPNELIFQQKQQSTKKIHITLHAYNAVTNNYTIGLKGLPVLQIPAPMVDSGQGVEMAIQNNVLTAPVTIANGFAKMNDDKTGRQFSSTLKTIQYNHIPAIHYFYTDSVKILDIDIKTAGKRIGYIAGAGDKVPEVLLQMGYDVSFLDRATITNMDLSYFDAIITGVRAYNIHEWLNDAYAKLMAYVKNGGNLIVQYNTNNNIGPVKAKMGPYNFDISRSRITDENASVKFIDPTAQVLQYPNKISEADFNDWIQERSTYHATNWDQNLKPIFSMHDPGEGDDDGALLTGKYGKGYFTYSGIAFFRQLPAAVPGAMRLFANIIALNAQNK